ncbi:MAG TPA: hypothetical protein VJK72_04535 [Candidatus Nanoarchaeia archaeon]|nr:hypothetical protein [Candidatus Nanoarchaeia archaeon]
MVERTVSKKKYIIAFFISIAVFVLGLLLGLFIESERLDYIVFQDQEQQLDLQSLHLHYQFSSDFAEQKNCVDLLRTFDTNLRNLERTRERIENYRRDATVNVREFDLLRREYVLSQVNYWLLYSRAKDLCELPAATVLYFFSDEENCADCEEQAIVLTWLKHTLGSNILTFVFDGEFDQEPIIPLLKGVYGIDEYPSIVVDGKVFTGFTSRKKILTQICPQLNVTACEPYVAG